MLRFLRRRAASPRLTVLLLSALLALPAAAQTFHRIPLPTTLGDVSGMQFGALTVTPDGSAAAVTVATAEGTYLYRWTASSGGQVIGRFDNFGINRISDDGRVIVFQSSYPHVIRRWTPEGGVEELARAEGTNDLSRTVDVTAVSNDGTHVVYARRSEIPSVGNCTSEIGPCLNSSLDEVFVWSPAQGERQLYARTNSTFRDETGPTPVYTDDLEELVVQDVSNDGAWLFGSLRENASNPGETVSFVQVGPDGSMTRLATRPQMGVNQNLWPLVEAASETGDVAYSFYNSDFSTREWSAHASTGVAPSMAHLLPSAQLLATSRALRSHVYIPDPGATAAWSVRVRDAVAGTETVLNPAGDQCYALAGFNGDTPDDALVVLHCYGGGGEQQVWTREGGLRPLKPLLNRAAAADSALVERTQGLALVTGTALHLSSGRTGEDAWVVSMGAPRLAFAVRDVTRFGTAGAPLDSVEVTVRGSVSARDTTGADGRIALPLARAPGLDPSLPADIVLRHLGSGLSRTYQALRPDAIADTTLTLPLDLVRRLNATVGTLGTSGVTDLPILREIGDAFLAYDTAAVRDLRAAWFRDLAELPAVHRQRDEHLGRLVASTEGLATLHASEAPLAGQVASVGVQAVTTLLSGQKAIQQIEQQIQNDASDVFATGAGEVLRGIALAVTQAGNSGLHGAYLAYSGAVESALPAPWNTAWAWLGEAATKGIGDGIAAGSGRDGGSAFLGTLIETVVEKTAGPLVDAVYIGQTQDDFDAAAQRARSLAGVGTPRSGFEASLTRANESAERLDARLSASTAVLATAKGWADFGDLTLVVGRIPGAQIAAMAGAAIRSVSFAGLAVDEVLNVMALHTAASNDSPSLVALAYGLPPTPGAASDPPGPTAARAESMAMQQRSASSVVQALDRYAAHLDALARSVPPPDRTAARVATDSLLHADADLRQALETTLAELSALAPPSEGVSGAQRRLGGWMGVLAGDGLRLYAGVLPHLVPELAEDPDGVADAGTLDGPMTGIVDTVLVRIPRVRTTLDSLRAAFVAAQATREGRTAPPTLVVADPGVDLPSSVAPGTFTVRVRVMNAGTAAADGVTATFTADGDTTGGPPAVLRLTSEATQALGTLAPGQTAEATWTVAARDTSAASGGASGVYRISTASTTEGTVTRRAVQHVAVSSQTGVGVDEPEVQAATGIESVYPNPARGAVSVRYALTSPQAVRVRVYDVLGREVTRIVEAEQAPGRYARAVDVSALAPGVYVVRVEAGRTSWSRPFTVVR